LGISQATSPYLYASALAATGNAITQGIAVATGLQERFEWKAVAVSAAAAPLTQGLVDSDAFKGATGALGLDSFGKNVAAGFVRGVVTQRIRMAVYNKGKLDYGSIAADAFGNALGASIVDYASNSGKPSANLPNADTRWSSTPASAYGYSDEELADLQKYMPQEPLADGDGEPVMYADASITRRTRGYSLAHPGSDDGRIPPFWIDGGDIEVPRLPQVVITAKRPTLEQSNLEVGRLNAQSDLRAAQAQTDAAWSNHDAATAPSQIANAVDGNGYDIYGRDARFSRMGDAGAYSISFLESSRQSLAREAELAQMRDEAYKASLPQMRAIDPVAERQYEAYRRGQARGLEALLGNPFVGLAATSAMVMGADPRGVTYTAGQVGPMADVLFSGRGGVQGQRAYASPVRSGGGVRATGLGYDISRWGEYGLPSDGFFVRTLTREQYRDFQSGRPFSFGGKPGEGYPSGMGFIGSAEEVRGLTTVQGYRDGLKLSYDPKYVLEFQLANPAGLQNVIRAPYAEFVPGGKTGAGFSEWNYPGISSSVIVNGKVRVLK
jgi:hypothetical protein